MILTPRVNAMLKLTSFTLKSKRKTSRRKSVLKLTVP